MIMYGPVEAVSEVPYKRKDGGEGVLRKIAIRQGLGSLWVVLTREVPTPGQGELVALEVGFAIKVVEGRTFVDWTAYRVAESLPTLAADPAPSRLVS